MAISLKFKFINFLSVALAMVLFVVATQGTSAQEAPTAEQLKSNLEQKLPAYWGVDNMAIQASANYGNAVEPVFKQRIVVTISPKVDLFLPVKQLGTTVLIEPTIKAQVPQKLFAISSSRLRAGKWITEFERETDPTKGMGQPRTAFGALTILQNSPEETAYWATQNADQNRQQQNELAKIARETELRKAELTQQEALNVAKIKQQQAQKATRDAAQAALIKSAAENVRRIIAAKIPTYWKVEKLTLADATGDPKIISFNYKANLLLMKDLFVVDAEQGSTKFLIPALSQGAKIIQTGTTISKNGPDGWIVTARPDNPVTKYDGLPVSMYAGPTVVRGTEQETAYYAARDALAERENAGKLVEIERQKAITSAQATAEATLQTEAADRAKQAQLVQIARQKEIDLAKAQAAKEALQRQATEQAAAEQRRAAAAAKTVEDLDALQISLASKSNSVRLAALQAALDNPNPAVSSVARQAIAEEETAPEYQLLRMQLIKEDMDTLQQSLASNSELEQMAALKAALNNPNPSVRSAARKFIINNGMVEGFQLLLIDQMIRVGELAASRKPGLKWYPFSILIKDFDPETNKFSASFRSPSLMGEQGEISGQIVENTISFSNKKTTGHFECWLKDKKWKCEGIIRYTDGNDITNADLWVEVFP